MDLSITDYFQKKYTATSRPNNSSAGQANSCAWRKQTCSERNRRYPKHRKNCLNRRRKTKPKNVFLKISAAVPRLQYDLSAIILTKAFPYLTTRRIYVTFELIIFTLPQNDALPESLVVNFSGEADLAKNHEACFKVYDQIRFKIILFVYSFFGSPDRLVWFKSIFRKFILNTFRLSS